jgi:crotonobetainyl-CoA:carnitine CoA-transferase CaiB-like acyl-CoA transferase
MHPSEGAIHSMKVSVRFSETTAEPVRLAPKLGEQSEEILAEAGFCQNDIASMVRDGVTKIAAAG